jgi:oxygen-independent coproporphyrinogen-3 oxidase
MCPFTHEPLAKRDLTAYVDALRVEMEFYSRHPLAQRPLVTSLYFGGGTASSLTPQQVSVLLQTLRAAFPIATNCQITLECHPRTVTAEYLAEVREHGINRVSFGIQSFLQRNIDSLRLHQRVEQSSDIIATACAAGFDSVAIDLMYRYPGQRTCELEAELAKAFELGVQSLSLYSLDPEVRQMRGVKEAQPSIAEEQEMFFYLHDRLEGAGWIHVAQPDYALPGHENRQLYDLWGAPQAQNLGFGAGAFSELFNGFTWANVHDANEYISMVGRGEIPILMGQRHSWDDAVSRYAALGVRCLRLPFEPFERRFGVPFRDVFKLELHVLEERGLATTTAEELVITRRGKFYIDNISKVFFNPANRGKSQLWGVDLGSLRPEVHALRADAVVKLDQFEWNSA